MRVLETRPVTNFNEAQVDRPDCFDVELPDGRQLGYEDVLAHTPAVTSSYDGYADPQLVLGTENGGGTSLWDESVFYPAGRLAAFHGRNLEVLASRVDIRDQFGNAYRSLCIKGSNFADPHFFESATASRDYIVYGLQESLVMERILRASRLLRANGVGTEYICGVRLPESFPLDEGNRTIDDKAPKTPGEFLERLATRFAVENQNGKSPLEITVEMVDRFKDCDYLVSYRAMDCPYRFGELAEGKFEALKEFICQNCEDPDTEAYFQSLDRDQYIQEYFVPRFAKNVAKMHKLGLTHEFLSTTNVTAFGSIVDLDSCKGEALGLGDELNEKEQDRAEKNDIFWAINSIEKVAWHNEAKSAQVNTLVATFLQEYINERFATQDQKAEFLTELLSTSYEATYISDENTGMYRRTQQIFEAFQLLKPDIGGVAGVTTILPDKMVDENLTRMGSYFLTQLPAGLFRSMRAQLLEDPYPRDDDPADTDKETTLNHVRKMIRNQCLLHFIPEMLFARHHAKEISARQVLFAVGGLLGQVEPDHNNDTINNEVQAMNGYFQEQTKQIVSRLCRKDTRRFFGQRWLENPLDQLSDETRKEVKDYVAETDLNSVYKTPVLYPKDEAAYEKILRELQIGKDTPMESVNFAAIRNSKYESRDCIVVVDNKVVASVAQVPSRRYAYGRLFAGTENSKPLLIISGLKNRSPKVQIFNLNGREPETIQGSYQDLLEQVQPLTTEPRQLMLSMA